MLSKESIEKLVVGGIYECLPKAAYRSKVFYSDLRHCCNWVFRLMENNGKYVMVDTYFASRDAVSIEVTDENVNEFEFILNLNEVKQIKYQERNQYEDYYCLAMDSSGWNHPNYYVDKDAEKSMGKVIEKLDSEIENLERQLANLRERKESILDGSYPFHLV